MSTAAKYPFSSPELWGGIECTINRVRDTYRDQLADTGYYNREGDIDAFAALGISKMRYPVLWENHLPDAKGNIDWQHTSARLSELRSKNIAPIAGLLHHGSGPADTDLLDGRFPEKLAAYAALVAARFPWLEFYTPVNEPLTTARFSGLYGFWYPHHQNEKSFILMLLNQVKGIILCMAAIRKINPAAKLVQTEDLCKIHSTPKLAYQASFENERRWLTYDLLCGGFKPGHALWDHCVSLGIPVIDLNFFAANPCPPEIIGFNYYITSERYLDERLDDYPSQLHGGNGRHRYADTDAARANNRCGLSPLLAEAWERYRLPIAITECHLNCSREEQMRWLKETWDICCALNRKKARVVAVTAWSLLGSFDWDGLLLKRNGHYESGVFDISSGYLRPTILAKMIRSFADGKSFEHPLLEQAGWWYRHEKKTHGNESKSLLFLSPDTHQTESFEKICRERGILSGRFAMNKLLSWEEAATRESPVINNAWGIVIILDEAYNQNQKMYEWAENYCRHYAIQLMLINPFTIPPEQVGIILQPGKSLLIQSEGFDGIKLAHRAMDLFIDRETGHWTIGEKGTRKTETKERVVYY